MRIYILSVLLVLSAQTSIATAQNRKAAKKTAKVEVPTENPRFLKMLSATQKVTFVDSIVVDRPQLLNAIYTNAEEGRLTTYDQFFATQGHSNSFVYTNQLGNKCVFSLIGADGKSHLYSSDLLGNEWSTPEPLSSLESNGLSNLNYPYMMPDGQTLYFAAQGGEGLGGYDIYRTRLDADGTRFLNPENVGMPFNSESDDVFYMVNEQDSLGFFATSRRQPEGKVCVYIFIPQNNRSVYDPDAVSEEKIRQLANIERIRDTWGNGQQRNAAMRRLERMKHASTAVSSDFGHETVFDFVINDHITYHRLQDFKAQGNAELMRQLLATRKQYDDTETLLAQMHAEYGQTQGAEQEVLKQQIVHDEEQLMVLAKKILLLEKNIRYNELNN